MFASKVVAALAVVGFASAASSSTNDACSQSTTTITSQSDASALASCETYKGNIVVDSSVAGVLALDGIQQINGDLTVSGATNLTSLTAKDMNAISGTMNLNGLTLLSTLQFEALTSIGTISYITLPALQSLTFPSTVSTCSSITIQDTQLASLDGINLNTVDNMMISSNNFLKTVSTQVANITQSLDIDKNGQSLSVQFPNLIWAGNFTIRDATNVSIPSLQSVNDTMGFYEGNFDTIAAPNLTSVGGVVVFSSNSDLSNLSMPLLSTVGGLDISNNDNLDTISLPELKTVTGVLNITGDYSDAEFPALDRVDGAFYMVSSSNFSCTAFDKQHSEDFLGTYKCSSTAKSSSSGSSGGSSTSSGSSSSSTGKSAAGQLTVPTSFGIIGGILALLL